MSYWSIRAICLIAVVLASALAPLGPAFAQVIGDEDGCDGDDQFDFACGSSSSAVGGASIAIGGSSGANYQGTAVGYNSQAGFGAKFATVAVGSNARSVGEGSVAIGGSQAGQPGTQASGDGSIAVGNQAGADGYAAVSLGYQSKAGGSSAVALGNGAQANFDGSIAVGNGVVTDRDNQIAIGNGNQTYTMRGINRQASKDAQSGTTYLVTSDDAGNMATSTFDLATLENLPDTVAAQGTAITTLNSAVSTNTQKISDHTNELFDHETRIASNTTQIGTLNTTVAGHTNELLDHETRITSNTDAIAAHTIQIADLDTRVTTNATNITQLDGRVGALESGFQDLGSQIGENRREARAGTALALATAGLRYDDRPGKLSLAGGFGNFKGQSGLALGLGYNPSLDFRLNGAISATTNHGDVGVSLGASWTLN
ncbi:YadA-like family protein [Mesorhizobium sp. M7A.F.Ca.US.011.01.1.1]|uniref:YadA-like family protein n=1 Tax=Mesorhizobium sp. M7A.F.Ca.US.011.01.1.1 TaxID=2496741 RepID=UPI0013E36C88|nr:YadA-like family protein [Mesorhizobium sp. M7A.F.Ca.US.011.01.1.1]